MLKYHLKHKEHKIHHPAALIYVITYLLLALTVLFGFISVFIPWAVKDIAVGQRAWAYPFKTCIQKTFSQVHEETCIDNDFIEPKGAPLTQGSSTCKAYVLATIAFVFIYVLTGVANLIVTGYVLEHLWWSPLKAAWASQILMIFISASAAVAGAMFFTYGEMTCEPNSIFPVHGYSYGYIMTIFASVMAGTAVITGFLGIRQIMVYQYVEDRFEEAARHEPGAKPYTLLPPVDARNPLAMPTPVPAPTPSTPGPTRMPSANGAGMPYLYPAYP